MYSQSIYGMHRCCPNRNCKAPFYKECHLGFEPRSEIEVYAVMRCIKCKDVFGIIQPISVVHEYKEKLPRDPKSLIATPSNPITTGEITRTRRKMEETNVLKSLFEGTKPGSPGYGYHEE